MKFRNIYVQKEDDLVLELTRNPAVRVTFVWTKSHTTKNLEILGTLTRSHKRFYSKSSITFCFYKERNLERYVTEFMSGKRRVTCSE